MTRLILVRHGQTAWNRAERFRGRSEVSLNATGLAQAHAAARRIVSSWKVDAVYSSPLKRGVETAQAIAQRCGLTAQPHDGLIDMDFGEWQGLTADEVSQQWPDLYREWLATPQKVTIPSGESLPKVRRRAMAALRDLLAKHPEGIIVIVSHQVVCKLLVLAAMGLPASRYWRLRQDNTAIDVFDYTDGGFVTLAVNDTCHIREASQ